MLVEDQLYSMEDLHDWSFEGVSLAVVGDPIAHSLSPQMHNAALEQLAGNQSEFAEWQYFRFQIRAKDLPDALPLFFNAGFRGINLTVPHKVIAFPLVKSVDPAAELLGAVNTLIRAEAGYRGANTDGFGISKAILESFGRSLADREVVLLGAGGAARSVATQALSEGSASVWIGNRSQSRLEELLAIVRSIENGDRVKGFLFSEIPDDLPVAPLIVNATASGLKASDSLPMDLDRFSEGTQVYDTTYGVRNAIALECDRLGFDYADGLSMLIWQGVRSLEMWTGVDAPVDAMRRAATDALAARIGGH